MAFNLLSRLPAQFPSGDVLRKSIQYGGVVRDDDGNPYIVVLIAKGGTCQFWTYQLFLQKAWDVKPFYLQYGMNNLDRRLTEAELLFNVVVYHQVDKNNSIVHLLSTEQAMSLMPAKIRDCKPRPHIFKLPPRFDSAEFRQVVMELASNMGVSLILKDGTGPAAILEEDIEIEVEIEEENGGVPLVNVDAMILAAQPAHHEVQPFVDHDAMNHLDPVPNVMIPNIDNSFNMSNVWGRAPPRHHAVLEQPFIHYGAMNHLDPVPTVMIPNMDESFNMNNVWGRSTPRHHAVLEQPFIDYDVMNLFDPIPTAIVLNRANSVTSLGSLQEFIRVSLEDITDDDSFQEFLRERLEDYTDEDSFNIDSP